jgi:hypothetical protein
VISEQILAPSSALRPWTITVAPAEAKARAMPFPIPLVLPVTSARRPARRHGDTFGVFRSGGAGTGIERECSCIDGAIPMVLSGAADHAALP